MSTIRTRLTAVAAHLPERTVTTAELEDQIADLNPGLEIPRGLVERFSGVRRRHLAPLTERPSDLAVTAARKVLDRTGTSPDGVDLLLFTGVSMDVIEPANANPVAAKLGLSCPVFDIRNACNSVCNAIEVADAFITTGRYRTVLIACGEINTMYMARIVADRRAFVDVAAGYTLSDAGAALLLEAGAEAGVLACRFAAHSPAWQAATMPIIHRPGDMRVGNFAVDAVGLTEGVRSIDPDGFVKFLADQGLTWDDFAVICIHQAALPALWAVCDLYAIPRDKTIVTIADHGNVAAATLPLQLAMATASGRVRRGDLVAFLGLASGFSAGLIVFRW
ncbi:3-oxoacyl-ACP synthase III family protein [Actinomadura sp. 9N215]|uniref:3-oxoacyl-ACP synthase III family protein n=1 Tax=Actinomadura sp. 9N215 TaxID=3375150 RepID=UPI0037BDA081